MYCLTEGHFHAYDALIMHGLLPTAAMEFMRNVPRNDDGDMLMTLLADHGFAIEKVKQSLIFTQAEVFALVAVMEHANHSSSSQAAELPVDVESLKDHDFDVLKLSVTQLEDLMIKLQIMSPIELMLLSRILMRALEIECNSDKKIGREEAVRAVGLMR